MKRLALAVPIVLLGLAGCASPDGEVELTREQACLAHFENDPLGRDRCLADPAVRGDTVRDVRPQDLPLPTGQPSG